MLPLFLFETSTLTGLCRPIPISINWRLQSLWSRAGRVSPFPIPETGFEALTHQIDLTARQAMTVVSLELRARYGAWFRRAGDS